MPNNEDTNGFEGLSHRLSRWLSQADDAAGGGDTVAGPDVLSRDRLDLINSRLEDRVSARAGLLKLLHDVTGIVNGARTIEGAFERVLTEIALHNGWCFGHAYLVSRNDPDVLFRSRACFEGDAGRFADLRTRLRGRRLRRGVGLPGCVLDTGEAAWMDKVKEEFAGRGVDLSDGVVRSMGAFAVKIENQVLAVLEFLSDDASSPDPRVMETMDSIGIHLGLFMVRKRMKRRIAELATLEQQRIGRDLHDDLGQQLTGVALLAKSLERTLRDESSAHADRAGEIARGLKEAQTHVRLLARGLVPVELDGKGLMNALADLARDSTRRLEIDVRFVARGDTLVDDNETATELYRIAQEAVTNAAKHGRATEITIVLSVDDDRILLEIMDNGVGVSEGTVRKLGVGMGTMVYRANVIGGELTIRRGESGGTMVRCLVSDDELPGKGVGDAG